MNQELLSRITLNQSPLPPDVFSDVAQEVSRVLVSQSDSANKSTQLRKFYDELLMWHEKVNFAPVDKRDNVFEQCLPFIQMLKAKVAYAKGRKYVDGNFLEFFNKLIDEIKSPTSLLYAKLMFEAVLGFRKANER